MADQQYVLLMDESDHASFFMMWEPTHWNLCCKETCLANTRGTRSLLHWYTNTMMIKMSK